MPGLRGQSLAAGGEDFVDKLIAALRHPEPTRAAVAIQILSEMLAEPRAAGCSSGLGLWRTRGNDSWLEGFHEEA